MQFSEFINIAMQLYNPQKVILLTEVNSEKKLQKKVLEL